MLHLGCAAGMHIMRFMKDCVAQQQEKKRKVYASKCGSWEALDRPMASRPLKGVQLGEKGEGACGTTAVAVQGDKAKPTIHALTAALFFCASSSCVRLPMPCPSSTKLCITGCLSGIVQRTICWSFEVCRQWSGTRWGGTPTSGLSGSSRFSISSSWA